MHACERMVITIAEDVLADMNCREEVLSCSADKGLQLYVGSCDST